MKITWEGWGEIGWFRMMDNSDYRDEKDDLAENTKEASWSYFSIERKESKW